MANFNTHLAGAALSSGVLTTFCYNAQLVNANHSVILWIVGTLAGLLPDVDSNNSTSLRVIFNTLSMMIAVLLIIKLTGHYPLLWIWGYVMLAYLILRWIALPIFRKITVHRGSWHSLLSGLCISMLIINAAWHITHTSAQYAWLLGLVTAVGFFTHLILDECYSFDLSNLRVKRSFGSACKPLNLKTPVITCALAIVTALQLWCLPPWKALAQTAHQLAHLHLLY